METTASTRLGKVLRDGQRIALRYERSLAHAPEKVWRALTESEQLQHWFPTDILGDREAGAELQFKFWPQMVEYATSEMGMEPGFDAVLTGELLTWDPPHVLEFRWDTEQLRYELHPDGDGTRLLFTVQLGEAPDLEGVYEPAAGYHVCLDRLAEALDAGTSAPPPAESVFALEQRYADELGVPWRRGEEQA